MKMHRRSFMASVGGAAAATMTGVAASAQRGGDLPGFDLEAFRVRANADGEPLFRKYLIPILDRIHG